MGFSSSRWRQIASTVQLDYILRNIQNSGEGQRSINILVYTGDDILPAFNVNVRLFDLVMEY